MKSKAKSTKFWLSIAAFLSSFGMGLLGYFSNNEALALTGIVCAAFSQAIYVYVEGKVDAADAASRTTCISATTTSKEIVTSILGKENNNEHNVTSAE